MGFEWDKLKNYCNNDRFVTSSLPDGFTGRYGAGYGEVTSANGAFGFIATKW